MTRDGLQRALIDLGWVALIHRVLGGKPSESYALYQMMRAPGVWVSYRDLAEGYELAQTAGPFRRAQGALTGTNNAVRKRIERLRDHLADLGLRDVIATAPFGEGAYCIRRENVRRIEDALLLACGFELEEAA